jgi:hypothetical protein
VLPEVELTSLETAWGAALSSKFNGHGYLEAGLHPFDTVELEAHFVTGFPHSSTRARILSGYKQYSVDIAGIVGPCDQYIDGSFVTSKNDPGDVDLVILVDAAVVDALPHDQKLKLKALVSGPATKAKYMCDAYFCPVYPDGHPLSSHSRQQRKYWLGEFGYDRNDVPKGIVHIKVFPPTLAAPPIPRPAATV